ncbi:NAD-dependent epimerase/dehydratase family protein [Leucobacter komagatae]|uniref:NAD-dependent epimerase/dehydratase family protein n=1 Tax=Leucobacter komagatae TaxID=55969 RepID=UPI0011544580|nr:NAD-dependent epimerase/dehydratase family protein [Leucobacter komagatae]
MRALVLGGTGAVGRAVAHELEARGHEALRGSRGAGSSPGAVRLDLSSAAGMRRLREVAHECDVVVDASGRDDPATSRELEGVPYVDTSATTSYLAELRGLRAQSGAATLVLGAGIAPGASTVLAAALASEPGDEIDVSVLLGTGEVHGPAAVAWTAGLAGNAVWGAPDGAEILNYRERRRIPIDGRDRTHLRTDFPDHLLLAAAGVTVRTYLTLGSPLATAGLALVGAVPALRGILAAAPHWGDDRWRVAALNRRTGEMLAASGSGQSRATGEFAALAAIRASESPGLGAVTMADLFGLDVLASAAAVTSRA